jgi:hypothetical protein
MTLWKKLFGGSQPPRSPQPKPSDPAPPPAETTSDLRLDEFELEIDDVFDIAGRGTVVTGVIKAGICRVGQDILLLEHEGKTRATTIKSIEVFRQVLQEAEAGQTVGVGLPDIPKREIQPGMKLVSATNKLTVAPTRREATPSATKPPTPQRQSSQPESEQEQPATIGGVKVLLTLNQKTVNLLQSKGVEWPEAICYFMAKSFGSRSELEISSDRASLSTVSKVRCETTPMYRDKAGVIYVLFEELDSDTKQKEGLEFLGTIDPKRYAGALCAQFGVTGKSIYV